MGRLSPPKSTFLKFLGVGIAVSIPWSIWLFVQWGQLSSWTAGVYLPFLADIGFRARGIDAESVPTLSVPQSSGLSYRAAFQIFRVIEQHYVDSERVVPEMQLALGLEAVSKLIQSSGKGTLHFARFPLIEEMTENAMHSSEMRSSFNILEFAENLTTCFRISAQSKSSWPLCEQVEKGTIQQGALEDAQSLVFYHEETNRALIVTLNAAESANDAENRLGHVSGSLLQWLEDIELDERSTIFRSFINEILHNLDPHSSFLNEVEYEDLRGGTRGQFGGVGVVINEFHGLPFVREIVANSPAQMAGIEPNDVLIRIGDSNVSFSGLEDVLRQIRRLTRSGPLPAWFFRPHSGRVYQTFFSREEVPTRSVEERIIPEALDVLHIRVSGFSSRTAQEIYDVYMNALRRQRGSLKAMILDLRGNPGGLLDQAVQVSDLFLSEGKIVVTKSRYDTQAEHATANQLISLPLVVLVNSSSASASEIVAGALKDSGRALILGERSFGKGSVQSLFEIPKFGALKMTIAHYFTPEGLSIQNTGVMPHVEIRMVQSKKGDLWVAGGSEKRREEDLLFHLDNPQVGIISEVANRAAEGRLNTQKDKENAAAADLPRFFEGSENDWIWSLTQDDLSNLGFLGELSFSYPNFENSDQVTKISEDAYVRTALKFIEASEQSTSGLWPLVKDYSKLISVVRDAENLQIKNALKAHKNSGFFETPVQNSFPDRGPSVHQKGIEITMESRPRDGLQRNRPLMFRAVVDSGLVDSLGRAQGTTPRSAPPSVLVGFAVSGHAEQPSAWQLVELSSLPSLPQKGSKRKEDNEKLEAKFSPSRLFWTAWSALAAEAIEEDPAVDIFMKFGPNLPARRVMRWTPDSHYLARTPQQIHTRVHVVENPEKPKHYTVHVDFKESISEKEKRNESGKSDDGIEGPCEVILAPFVNRDVKVKPLESNCNETTFQLEIEHRSPSSTQFQGIVGYLLRDGLGAIRARSALVEIIGNTVQVFDAK